LKKLVAIVGPTGIGKTRLALHLAGLYNGEIISADSRQVYRYMDIGTANHPAEIARIPTTLNVVNPDEFSLLDSGTGQQAIENILARPPAFPGREHVQKAC
jgi:tRNA dimethylallyltransferase